jgi:hydrogenase expression/formation protein HypC
MCLAIPSRIVCIEGHTAVIDVDGVRRKASLLLLDDAQVGEYVIVHAGFAIHRIDEAAAMESLALLRESLAAMEGGNLTEPTGLTLNREIGRTE